MFMGGMELLDADGYLQNRDDIYSLYIVSVPFLLDPWKTFPVNTI